MPSTMFLYMWATLAQGSTGGHDNLSQASRPTGKGQALFGEGSVE